MTDEDYLNKLPKFELIMEDNNPVNYNNLELYDCCDFIDNRLLTYFENKEKIPEDLINDLIYDLNTAMECLAFIKIKMWIGNAKEYKFTNQEVFDKLEWKNSIEKYDYNFTIDTFGYQLLQLGHYVVLVGGFSI